MNNISNIIEYIVCCVSEFASQHKLAANEAYSYLNKFGGIDFLIECYDAEHTLSIDDAVEDLQTLCHNNGGVLA